MIYGGPCDMTEARAAVVRLAGSHGRVRNEKIEVQRLSTDPGQAYVIYQAEIQGADYPGSLDTYRADLTRLPIPTGQADQYVAELAARIEGEQAP